MKKTIWKFPVYSQDSFEHDMPEGAQIIAVDTQYEGPQMWALVNPDAPKRPYRFYVVGTGHNREDLDTAKHVGTFQLLGGKLVWHVFVEEQRVG